MYFFLNLFETDDDIIKLRKNLLIASFTTILISTLRKSTFLLPSLEPPKSIAESLIIFFSKNGCSTLLGAFCLITSYLLVGYTIIIVRDYYQKTLDRCSKANDAITSEQEALVHLSQDPKRDEKITQHLETIDNNPVLQELIIASANNSQKIQKLTYQHQTVLNASSLFLTIIPILLSFYAVIVSCSDAVSLIHRSWPY